MKTPLQATLHSFIRVLTHTGEIKEIKKQLLSPEESVQNTFSANKGDVMQCLFYYYMPRV